MVWGCVLASLIYMWLSNFSNCLLKKLSTHCIFFFLFKDLLSISVWVYFWVFMLLHWFIYLYFCQYQPILSTLSFVVGEGNGTPLQYSCLEIPWTEEPDRLQSMGSQRVGHYWATSFSLFTFMHWRRKWQPTPVLNRLENPRDRGAWWAAIYGVTQSRTGLKWLSSSSWLIVSGC